jgi:hypothetical protein
MRDRRRALQSYLEHDEKVRWDGSVVCENAPPPLSSSPHDGYLLVTDHKLIYLPDDEAVEILRFGDVADARFAKRNRNSVVNELRMASGDIWTFDGFPRLAKRTQKSLRRSRRGKK